MSHLTAEQIALVRQYSEYSLEDLYNLVGNLAAEYGDNATQRVYVLGMPNVFQRGKKIVEGVRDAICNAREKVEEAIQSREDTIDPARASVKAPIAVRGAIKHQARGFFSPQKRRHFERKMWDFCGDYSQQLGALT